ncbi:MAG: aconitate hydratase [Chloroflexi bacterium]|nr:aconitate hydratase [Chloroflexota bacterium]
MNLTHQVITKHLEVGRLTPGEEILLRVDQTLTEDATALAAYQELEALKRGLTPGVEAISFVDHSPPQLSPQTEADHNYLRTVAAHYGLYYSPFGNGICHSVFLERFAQPGAFLVGADSHTPTAGAVGSLGIGAGSLELAVAMATGHFYLRMPSVVGVELTGELRPWVSAKDVIMELLRRLGVQWGVGQVIEYFGPGVGTLNVSQRATITNMGAELELTSSIFPADEETHRYLVAQGRQEDFVSLAAGAGADYDEQMTLDLGEIEPLIALPSSPGNATPLHQVAGTPIEQVIVGSCNNSRYEDLALVARLLRGHRVPENVTLAVTPGTSQVREMLSASGSLDDLVAAGARVLDSYCGPCIGMELRPTPGAASLRTYNRNFPNRSGTRGDQVYLCSPAVAVASALAGQIADPRDLGEPPKISLPDRYPEQSGVIPPPSDPGQIEIVHGPNYTPVPTGEPLSDVSRGRVLIVLGDEVTTDRIMPGRPAIAAGANIQALGDLVFTRVDADFPTRARAWGGGFVVGGSNYGQGSSREQAVLGPLVLGIRAIVARSYARIHHTNLVNFGILPLVFADPDDYDIIEQGDEWEMHNLRDAIQSDQPVIIYDRAGDRHIKTTCSLTPRQAEILLAGGLLNLIRQQTESDAV